MWNTAAGARVVGKIEQILNRYFDHQQTKRACECEKHIAHRCSEQRPQEKDGSFYSSSSCGPFTAHTMSLQCEWMLQCYLRHNILSERRGRRKKKKEQRGEKCLQYPGDHLGTSRRGHHPLRDFFTLSRRCWLSDESESFYTPPVFAYLWCEVPSWIPHSHQTGSQPATVCVCSSCERKCLRAKHCHVRTAVQQADETWGSNWQPEGHAVHRDVCFKPAGSRL